MKDTMAKSQVHLPSDRAFVVQFTPERVDAAAGHGRAEHLATGEAIRFDSLADLGEFFARVLADASGETNP